MWQANAFAGCQSRNQAVPPGAPVLGSEPRLVLATHVPL